MVSMSSSLILHDCTPLGLVIVPGNHLELLLLLKSQISTRSSEKYRIVFSCHIAWPTFSVAVILSP